MKNSILIAIGLCVTMTGTAFGQVISTDNNKPLIKITGEAVEGKQPLIYLDGVKQESGALTMIDPNKIKTVSIIKDAQAISKFGTEASNGVILIRTKDALESDSLTNAPLEHLPANYPQVTVNPSIKIGNIALSKLIKISSEASPKEPVYVLDGKIVKNPNEKIIAAENVKSISIIKGSDASKIYGEIAADGVIIISTKTSGKPE